MKYKCQWCDYIFQEEPIYKRDTDRITGRLKNKGIISTTIKCPNCTRLIPTASKEEVEGSHPTQHIHRRSWGNNKMLYGTKLVDI